MNPMSWVLAFLDSSEFLITWGDTSNFPQNVNFRPWSTNFSLFKKYLNRRHLKKMIGFFINSSRKRIGVIHSVPKSNSFIKHFYKQYTSNTLAMYPISRVTKIRQGHKLKSRLFYPVSLLIFFAFDGQLLARMTWFAFHFPAGWNWLDVCMDLEIRELVGRGLLRLHLYPN